MKAPLIAIVAYDTRFWEHLPRMFHNPQAINWFKDKGAHTEITAFRNGTLQGGYFLLALRARRPRLRRDVRVRQRQGRRRVLPRRTLQVEFPGEHRLRHAARTCRRATRGLLSRRLARFV